MYMVVISQAIKDWMLVIMVMVIVGLEMVVMTVGTAIPESRLTANATLVNEDRQNVKKKQRNVHAVWLCYTLYINYAQHFILCTAGGSC